MPVGSALYFARAQPPVWSPVRTAAIAFLPGVLTSSSPVPRALNFLLFLPNSTGLIPPTCSLEGDPLLSDYSRDSAPVSGPCTATGLPEGNRPFPHFPRPPQTLLQPKGSLPLASDVLGLPLCQPNSGISPARQSLSLSLYLDKSLLSLKFSPNSTAW